ncbi:MAG: nucleoside recognition protein [Deltaproteobacteria bacterium]|nr:nucleoside recognition protein [Deltaproteobacteria bacterium]
MRPSKAEPKYISLAVSCVISVAVLICGTLWVENLGIQRITTKLLWPLTRLMFFITLGLVVGQTIEALGWTKKLAKLAGPMFRFSKLGQRCGAAFVTAFLSGVTANAMLLDFYKDEKITRKQLFLSNFVNQMPAYFLHLPTTFFIVIPLTGWAGALYFLLTFSAMVVRTIIFLIYGHFQTRMQPDDDGHQKALKQSSQEKKSRGLYKIIREKLPGRISGIAVYVLPIYVVVYVLNAMGMFEAARKLLAGYVVTSFVPMESLSVVILSFAAEFTSGFAAAGALLDAGVLTTKQTVLALLIGNIVAFPVRALRHQLPRYIGIFAPKMGTQLLLMGQSFRIMSLVFVGYIYYLVG